MKQCIKYCIIAILAVLLHNGAIGAADFLCTPVNCKAESCVLTQAPTAQQAIQNYYNHLSSTSSCLEYVEHMQVPSNKGSLLRVDIIRMQQLLRAQVTTLCRTYITLPFPTRITTYSGLERLSDKRVASATLLPLFSISIYYISKILSDL